jgi:molybdopterin synthase sulfur carrier subunit
MSSRLLLPAPLRHYADGREEVEISGGTLGAALDDLALRLPQLERRLRDERGELRPHVLMFVNGVSVRTGAPMETPVGDGAEIFVAPAVSGGGGRSEVSANAKESGGAPRRI